MSRRASVSRKEDAVEPLFCCGTSGWAYSSWKPAFYPSDISSKKFLSFYATQLNSLEVNYTFSRDLTAKMTADWLAATPSGFYFTFKAPQRITHWQRLRESADTLSAFIEGLQPFREAEKLGCLLFQLPHNFKPDHTLLREFLALPAFRLHRTAVEFLHEGWFSETTYDLLREHGVALCESDSEKLQAPSIETAAHRYHRLRQPGGYSKAALYELSQRFAAITQPSFVYFRHEEEPTGALQARELYRSVIGDTAA